jgi:bile acid:Na+ symporter, BASS family
MRRVVDAVLTPLPLVLIAAGAGLLWPSRELAGRSDLILAALVLAVALTIDPRRFRTVARARGRIAAAVLLPLAVLLPVAIAIAALFDGAAHDGLIALGLASTEVAAAGLVGLAGGDAALTLTVVALSLGVTAAAPIVAPLLVGTVIEAGELIVRFSLVVLVPLAVGLAVRARTPSPHLEAFGDRIATLVLALLVYAALGDLGDLSCLGDALAAAALFLAASVAIAMLLRPVLGELRTGGFVFALRDFAVAAALAGQFDTPGAAATPAVYGILMLTLAAAAAPMFPPRDDHSGAALSRSGRPHPSDVGPGAQGQHLRAIRECQTNSAFAFTTSSL